MTRSVDFYYAIGSRYCYLAQSQVAQLEAIGPVTIRWRPLLSEALMRARGLTPFQDKAVSVQYLPEYRSEDAARWAAFYGIPYREPDWKAIDWRRVNMAAVALACRGRRRIRCRVIWPEQWTKWSRFTVTQGRWN